LVISIEYYDARNNEYKINQIMHVTTPRQSPGAFPVTVSTAPTQNI